MISLRQMGHKGFVVLFSNRLWSIVSDINVLEFVTVWLLCKSLVDVVIVANETHLLGLFFSKSALNYSITFLIKEELKIRQQSQKSNLPFPAQTHVTTRIEHAFDWRIPTNATLFLIVNFALCFVCTRSLRWCWCWCCRCAWVTHHLIRSLIFTVWQRVRMCCMFLIGLRS